MRKAMLSLCLLFLLPVLGLAATTVAVSDHPEIVTARVVESDVQRTVLEYDLGSFTRTPIEIDGETFYSIELAGESPSKEQGLPQLPNISRSIVIPDNAEMTVRVVSSHYVDYPNLPVAPSKGFITRNIDPSTVAYSFNPFYGSSEWYPSELAYARDPYIMRDIRGMVVVVNPMQYNPATQTLRVYDRIVVEVERVGSGKVNVLTDRPATMNNEFKKIYERHFLNFDSTTGRYPALADAGNMLVICYDDPAFLAAMQPLVEWKNQMGVPCEMVTTTDAGGSAAGFDAYITQYYNDNGVSHVLLVGDAAQLPSLSSGGGASDPSFSTISGDMYPDLFVGRFSAESASQVETQVLRTIEYEKRPQTGGDWYHKGMGVASNQGPGDDNEYDDEHLDNIRADLLGFTYTEVDQIYDPSGTASMVSTGLNTGRSVINYTGHGSTTAWSSTGFSNTHVNALVNDNMLPFIISVACVNGQFSSYTCFAEAWMRATNGAEPTGAIGTYMSSINQSWDPPMDAQDEVADLLVGTAVEGARRTFGGICFNGSSHMMDEYGTGGESMFLTWNIFGDPSLRVRTDTPAPITVNHISVIYPNMTDFAVEVVGVEDALVALYGDGVLYGSALTDATGNATVPIGTMPTPGTFITLTVTGFNTETYTADIPVIVPVTYDISPATIPVNVSSAVTITVWDNGGAPLPDVEITVGGWGIAPVTDVTDGAGQALFVIDPPYGENLTVIASEIGEVYNCFEDVLPVTGAMALTSPDIDASVASIGLYGSLAPHYEGSVAGTAGETGLVIYALGCGVDASAGPSGGTTVEALVTPTSAGTVAAALAKDGYNVYLEDISVDVVYGQLAGGVYDAALAPIGGAVLKGYPAGSDTTGATPVFAAVSAVGGGYDMGIDIEVGYYDVYVSKFGYLTASPEVFIQYGPNDNDFILDSAPSGVVTGTVTETGTGLPLEATIKIYRSDNMELFLEATSSPVTGNYTFELPYFNYQMNVRAYHHIPENRGITVSVPAQEQDFELDVTLANILVISDGVRGEQEAHKIDEAGNIVDYWSGDGDLGRSGVQIATDLVALGYDVTEEDATVTDPATWLTNYDFILWAAGDNTSPLESEILRNALEAYVAAGGKLLIEGGEIAYDAVSYPGYPTFAANVLHCDDWNHDSSGNLTVHDGSHRVTTFPNTIGTIAFSYSNYGDQDAAVPTSDADMVCSWSDYSTD
ncbi:MAG TPA: C25 family cysteine peptidase, partial [bacterium]|nr:C25 family cysteine peptidase [bacterium]